MGAHVLIKGYDGLKITHPHKDCQAGYLGASNSKAI